MPDKDEVVAAIKVEADSDSRAASQHPAAAGAESRVQSPESRVLSSEGGAATPDSGLGTRDSAAPSQLATRDSELGTLNSELETSLRAVRRLLAAGVILGVLAGLYFASAVFMPIAAGLLLSFLFKPIVRRLDGWRIPPPASALLIIGSLFVATIAGLGAATESMQGWLETMPQAAEELEVKFRDFSQRFRQINEATEKIGAIASGGGGAAEMADGGGRMADGRESRTPEAPGAPGAPELETLNSELETPPSKPVPVEVQPSSFPTVVLSTTAATVAGLTVTMVLAYFFLASGDLLLRQLVQMLPSLPEKREAVEAWRDLETQVSSYLATVTVINAGLGVVTWAVMSWFGLPYAMWWGITAGVFNFIPYIGPLVVAVAVFLAGVLAFDSIGEAFGPPLAFIALQTIEGYVITPTVVGRRMSLNPLVLFIWLIFWGWMWGIVGGLLAVPMLICFKIVCDHVEALEPASNLLSGYVRRAGEMREEEG